MNKIKITEKYRQGAGYNTFTWKKDIEFENLIKENKMMSEEPTYKQKAFIKSIEEKLHIQFKGESKKDAYDFINQYIEEFKNIS